MTLAMLSLQVALALTVDGSEFPVQAAYAYSRETLPGIPAGLGVEAAPGRSLETTFFIYVVLRRDLRPTQVDVCVKGRLYAARLQAVPSPVLVAHDPVLPDGAKDTLVPATSAAVYQVLPGEEKNWSPADDAEARLTRDNDVVIFIQSGAERRRVPIQTIQPLPSAPGR